MKKILWRIRLFALLNRFGYTKSDRWNIIKIWRWTGSECWIDYYEDGYSAIEAIKEDMSYA